MNKCRVCNGDLFAAPLIRYSNMPKSAQYFASDTTGEDKGVDLEVCQCSGCGLVQLNNEPVDYYREVIRAGDFSEEMRKFREAQIRDFVWSYGLKGKRVVEIGCGCGEHLAILNNLVDAFGLEYGHESVEKCRESGLRVEHGFIESKDQKIAGSPFDGFLVMSILEHMPDPNTILRGIYGNLKEYAVGIVEVPNFGMILKKRLFSEFMSDHLLYFTEKTFKLVLEMNGFEVVECREIRHEYILSAVVRKREPLNLFAFGKQQKKIKEEIDAYMALFREKKVALWGAGHQALAILSLLELGNKIKCVIDSAPFKQNKYTPVTRIPIISPDKINAGDMDAIIVVAGSYSDEVAKIAKEQFAGTKIAILRGKGLEVIV